MALIPKISRCSAGRYKMRSGDEYVRIYRLPRTHAWMAQPRGYGNRYKFRTKQEAAEFAYDWLAEHA